MIANLCSSRIVVVVVVVHIPLAKPMTSGDDAELHRDLPRLVGSGYFIANKRRTCILIDMHRCHSFLYFDCQSKVGL